MLYPSEATRKPLEAILVALEKSWGRGRVQGPVDDRGAYGWQPPLTNYRFLGIDELVFGS
jgi:hypothetical protein